MPYTQQTWQNTPGSTSGGLSATSEANAERMTVIENGIGAATDLGEAAAPKVSPAFTGTPTAPTPAVGNNSTRLATSAFVAGALTAAQPATLDVAKTAATSFTANTFSDDPDLQGTLGVGTWDISAMLLYDGSSADDGKIQVVFSGTGTMVGVTSPVPLSSSANTAFTNTSNGTAFTGSTNIYTLVNWNRTIVLGCGDDGLTPPGPFPFMVYITIRAIITVSGTLKIIASKNTAAASTAFRLLTLSNMSAVRIAS